MEIARAKEVLKNSVHYIQFQKPHFEDGVETMGDEYKLVTEAQRKDAIYVHIVPMELYNLFRKWQKTHMYTFEGKSILLGRRNEKELRVTFYGVDLEQL